MSGGSYIALSGLRARIDDLDRLADDIANVGTAGYKGERTTQAAAERGTFDETLQTAIDTTLGGRRLDTSSGAIAPTGRSLDVAIDGDGYFVVNTPAGDAYTRNGHFSRRADGVLVTDDGSTVQGQDGPITVGDGGEIRVDSDGTVWAGASAAGKLKVVQFDDPGQLVRLGSSALGAGGLTPQTVDQPLVRAGALEQSNVLLANRIAELTNVSRSFEALQKSLSLMVNDVDGRAIEQLGRH